MNFHLSSFMPEIIVFVGACVLLLMSVLPIPNKKMVLGISAFAVPLIALVNLVKDIPYKENILPAGAMVVQDSVADFCCILLLLIASPVLLSSFDMFSSNSKRQGEFLFLLLLSLGFLMLMVQATNLIVLFLAIEGASIPLYMLAGLRKGDIRSKEAVVKYFILGAFASAITIYGISLIFAQSLSFDFAVIAKVSSAGSIINTLTIGFVLVVMGLGFKVAAFPFHFWAPDVYEGSPPVSTSFISVAPKIGALIALSRFVGFAMPEQIGLVITYLLMGVSVASMTYGNITALLQTEVKRLMAYSSIAQIGYMLISVVVISSKPSNVDMTSAAIAGIMMYVTAYALMNIGAFSIINVVEKERGGTTLDHFKGLSKTHPGLALAMVVILVSLLGIPFTVGFFGKLYVFSSAVGSSIIWIVIVAILNSALSAFYYFNIVKAMYIESPENSQELSMTYLKNPATISSFICTVGILFVGLVPAIYAAIDAASKAFGVK
ncbi:MAG: NADH-quinone oxidoreductase subunit N [Caldisericia bacterium]|nr:NADH-quinone oxidoreductase subunit N [Caldisericia bacterium]